VRHSDTILFSAAIPGQGGTGHINEQWPPYWIRLFEKNGFHCHDAIRPLIWNRDEITAHFRQNMLLFVKDGIEVQEARRDWGGASLVHPRIFFNAFSPPRNLKSILQLVLRKNKRKFENSIE
jgi:hypothetical protein